MLHADVTKYGNIPDGGGHRYVGRIQGRKHRAATPGKPKSRHADPKMGTAFVHTVIDDHSRVAYAEIHDDETAATAAAVLQRAVAWYAARGVTVQRVLTDNGSAYRSHLWRDTSQTLGYPKRTGRTGPRPTARSNDSTAPSAAGPTTSSTPPKPPAEPPCQRRSTTTTTTGPTPPSTEPSPSAA